MSTITRTLRNMRTIGIREFLHQMQYQGDTKAGTFIAADRYGNKYYENLDDELPCQYQDSKLSLHPPVNRPPDSGDTVRTRWVDYKENEFSPDQLDPGWHAWMSYLVDKPPTEDPILRTNQRSWEIPEHRPNMTASRGAFKTYSTVKPKIHAWLPEAKPR